jgi:2-oxoglutarate dehydrogenase E1 component
LDYIGSENPKAVYIGRNPAASPASGHQKKHLAQQEEIIEKVFKQ